MRKTHDFLTCLLLAVAAVFLSPALTSAQTSVVQPQITAAVDNTARATIAHSTHPLALPAYDTGRMSAAAPMERMILVLGATPDQDYRLRTLLDSQQTQGSPDFHHWLTPDEFGQQFGPALQDIQAITGWLQSQGFTIGSVARSGRWIEFSGTVAQVESAFQTQMHTYQVNGESHIGNSSDISIPAALAPVVRGVASLHNFFSQPMIVRGPLVHRMADGTLGSVGPDTNLTGGTHGLSPADFAKIYDVPNSLLTPAPATVLNGTGETIAIVARTDIVPTDVDDFRTVFGLPASPTVFTVNGPDPGIVDLNDQAESTLDASWSGAVAPGATINVVVSGSTLISDGVFLSIAYIVDHDLAPIMSVSFGNCESNLGGTSANNANALLNAFWQQAAAQGMSVFVSTGDTGAAGCDPNAPAPPPGAAGGVGISGFASTPFDTAVGGTEFNETAGGGTSSTFWSLANGTNLESAIGYIPEMIWNDSCINCVASGSEDSLEAGGGGLSTVYPEPPYQTLNVTGLAAALGFSSSPAPHPRGIPDVSLAASPNHDGYLLCFNRSCEPTTAPGFLLIGGTSVSTPAFAGVMALVDQKLTKPQGLANYVLYPLAVAENYSTCNSSNRTNPAAATTCVFNDITVGNIGVPGNDTTNDPTAGQLGYVAGTGYDLASGLGSVDSKNLINAWAGATFQGSVTTLSPATAINITHGTPVTLTAAVTKNPSGAGPTGEVALIAQGGNLTGSVGVGSGALAGGSSSITVNNLPGSGGAPYHLTANYSGDGTFAGSASSSPGISVTVAKEAPFIQLAAETQTTGFGRTFSIAYGDPIVFETLVTGQASTGVAGDGIATGNVTFTDTVAPMTLTTLPLIADGANVTGDAEFFDCFGSPNCFTVGSTHMVNVNYAGDNSFTAANTNNSAQTVSVTVNSAGTTTTVSSPSAGMTVSSAIPVVLNASVTTSSNGAGPNGKVTFFSNGSQLGSPVTVTGTAGTQSRTQVGSPASATASLSIDLPAGTDNITAQYNGDNPGTNYAASAVSAAIVITAQAPAATVTTMTAAPNPATIGQAVTLTATVTPNTAPTLTGTVQFSQGGTNIGSPATIASGKAQLTTMALPAGSPITIKATYSGDSNYASSSGTTSETVTQSGTTTAVVSSAGTIPQGGNVTFTATITPNQANGPALTGTVQFAQGSTNLGGAVTVSGDQAKLVNPTLVAGTNTVIKATYSGDSNYTGSSGTTTETVQTFSVAANPGNITVAQGATGQTVLTFLSADGLTATSATINACTGLSEATCSFTMTGSTPTTNINLPANGTAMATLFVATTAPSKGMVGTGRRPGGFGWWTGSRAIALACLLCTGVFLLGLRRRERRWTAVFGLLACAFVFANVGCGGGGMSNPGTPVGNNQPITVSITIGGVQQTVPGLTVTVTAGP